MHSSQYGVDIKGVLDISIIYQYIKVDAFGGIISLLIGPFFKIYSLTYGTDRKTCDTRQESSVGVKKMMQLEGQTSSLIKSSGAATSDPKFDKKNVTARQKKKCQK